MVRRVSLTLPDPQWSARFQEERSHLLRVAGPLLLRLEHVGSTAIPGAPAKPVQDLLGRVRVLREADALVRSLATSGYEYVPENEATLPDRRYFRKGPPEPGPTTSTWWNSGARSGGR